MKELQVLFPSGESVLSATQLETLTRELRISRFANWVELIGHADSSGDSRSNLHLSEERARTVEAALRSADIGSIEIDVTWEGDRTPAASNDTPEGRAQNRRVEVRYYQQEDFVAPEPPRLRPSDEDLRHCAPAVEGRTAIIANSPWVTGSVLAPKRMGNAVQFFVDGADYMADASEAIDAAKRFIHITDWEFTCSIRLKRPGKRTILDQLREAAERGVIVRVLLYCSLTKVLNNRDKEARRDLEAAHSNIKVRLQRFAFRFSHHQKTAVMDDGSSPRGRIGYLGGVDFCRGRWDTPDHPLEADRGMFRDHFGIDINSDKYVSLGPDRSGRTYSHKVPPKHYYNGEFRNPLYPAGKDAPNRQERPRMPWHDLHLRVEGPSVADVERNFVERWNFDNEHDPLEMSSQAIPDEAGSALVQITRSGAPYSVGCAKLDDGILSSYLKAIRSAQHHIYIEQQFFTSGCPGEVHNTIMEALAERIIRAVKANERFRVKIVLPVHPEGDIDKGSVKEVLHWQNLSLAENIGVTTKPQQFYYRGAPMLLRKGADRSLFGRVLVAVNGNFERLNQYVGVYALRNHGILSGTYVTEQIYVHAKLMIVDDRVVILGSANINDRSMLGNRDSELNATVIDTETIVAPIDGELTTVRKAAHDLRVKLWQEHLGLTDDSQVKDPVCEKSHTLWNETAQNNTHIFEQVFPNIPSDRYSTRKQQKRAPSVDPSKVDLLKKIRGHLTLYSSKWLSDESLDAITYPDSIFH